MQSQRGKLTHALRAVSLAALLTCATMPAGACGKDCPGALGDLLSSLNTEQVEEMRYPLDSRARTDWTYVPWGHHGLAIRDMNDQQRGWTDALVRSALSPSGIAAYQGVLELERELWENTLFKPFRDPGKYYLALFGEPTAAAWSWRFGGHHLSINVTHTGEGTFATPFFTGANPASVKEGKRRGLRVLGLEEDMARNLLVGLDTDQRTRAVIDEDAPADILTGRDPVAELACCEGLRAADMQPAQRQELRLLVERLVGKLHPDLAAGILARMKTAGFDELHFAWAGAAGPGEEHYFRIHGPSLLIEYDNTQDDANHVHLVVREPGLDFGGDPMRAHLAADPHK